jgi:hypothetical protein
MLPRIVIAINAKSPKRKADPVAVLENGSGMRRMELLLKFSVCRLDF